MALFAGIEVECWRDAASARHLGWRAPSPILSAGHGSQIPPNAGTAACARRMVAAPTMPYEKAFRWFRLSGRRTCRTGKERNMSLIRRLGTLRTPSFTVGAMLGLGSATYPRSSADNQLPAHRPDHNWHSISGQPPPTTGSSRLRRRSIGGCASSTLLRARRSCTTRITRCNSSTTRSSARRIPRFGHRRLRPE